MNTHNPSRKISRRDFLKLAGGLVGAGLAATAVPLYLRRTLAPVEVAQAQGLDYDLFFASTDGWIYLPPSPAIPPFHPDDIAPPPFNTYMFGFRNITHMTEAQYLNQKMKAQHTAPTFWVDQWIDEANSGPGFKLKLTNLGLQIRPDLTDPHSVHWHGFRDATPFFDGEPHGSFSVPIGKAFTYAYRPQEPGTYMYHCHVEDVEHVQMGMTGLVFVRPKQDGDITFYPSGKYAYNDNDGSTGFDREFVMLLTEIWANSHWADSHIQLPEWSDYKPDFYLLNGRVYPDTLAPNGSIDPFNPVYDANGDLIPTPGYERLQYQPLSSLVQCNAGERVLLRFASLGFLPQTMVLTGIPMRVVGEDATPLLGRDGTPTSYTTESLSLNAGQSADVIFVAPDYQGPGPYDTYLLYNRNYQAADNLDASGYGGQMTEVRVYPATGQPGSLGPQTLPNT